MALEESERGEAEVPRPRRPRGRSGVSPVVSDVMMTAVVVICMTILLAWTVSYVFFNPGKEAVRERLAFEDVWFTEMPGYGKVISVYLYNYGPVDITVDYVSVEPGGRVQDADYVEGKGLKLDPGGHGRITFRFDWESGKTYYIKVFSRRGSSFEVMAVAP